MEFNLNSKKKKKIAITKEYKATLKNLNIFNIDNKFRRRLILEMIEILNKKNKLLKGQIWTVFLISIQNV